MRYKTAMMKLTEEKLGRPLEEVLPEMMQNRKLSDVAAELHISKATLSYWLLKLGIELQRVPVGPGQRVQVVNEDEDKVKDPD